MSSTMRPSPEQIDAIKLEQIINDIDQKRADYLRKEQERRFEPLKLMLQAMAAAATLVAAGVALGAFLVSRMH